MGVLSRRTCRSTSHRAAGTRDDAEAFVLADAPARTRVLGQQVVLRLEGGDGSSPMRRLSSAAFCTCHPVKLLTPCSAPCRRDGVSRVLSVSCSGVTGPRRGPGRGRRRRPAAGAGWPPAPGQVAAGQAGVVRPGAHREPALGSDHQAVPDAGPVGSQRPTSPRRRRAGRRRRCQRTSRRPRRTGRAGRRASSSSRRRRSSCRGTGRNNGSGGAQGAVLHRTASSSAVWSHSSPPTIKLSNSRN